NGQVDRLWISSKTLIKRDHGACPEIKSGHPPIDIERIKKDTDTAHACAHPCVDAENINHWHAVANAQPTAHFARCYTDHNPKSDGRLPSYEYATDGCVQSAA